MKAKKIALAVTAALIVLSARSQLNPANLTAYTDVEATEIFDVLSDKKGNIWIAAQSGLMRYDGYDVVRFHPDPEDSTTLGDLLTYSLFEDSKGSIWIGGFDFISQYNPETETFVNYRYRYPHLVDYPPGAQPTVWSIAEGSHGQIFFGVSSGMDFKGNHAVLYFNPEEKKIIRLEYPESIEIDDVYLMSADTAGQVLVSASSGGFVIGSDLVVKKLDIPEGIKSNDQPFEPIQYADHKGFVWIANAGSELWRLNPETGEYKSWSMAHLFPGQTPGWLVDRMIEDPDGNIWMGTRSGPVFFNLETETFEVFDYGSTRKIQSGAVFGLQIDAFGDLWFGSTTDGLMRYSKKANFNAFKSGLGSPETFGIGWASKIVELNNGTTWISTTFAGRNTLNLVNVQNGTILKKYENEILGGRLIAEFPTGQLLMEYENKFYGFDPTKNDLEPIEMPAEVTNSHLLNVLQDGQGNTFFCTVDGLFIQNPADSSTLHINLQKLPGSDYSSNEVTAIVESNRYGIWILTNNGLFLYDIETKSLDRLGFDASEGSVFASQDINSFFESEDGTAWVGTWQGGLSKLWPQEQSIKTYTLEDGLPSLSIQGIIGDENNQTLWISTFDGLCSFDIQSETFRNYTISDGIHSLLFSDGASLKSLQEYFLFGGNNGVTYFHPEDFAATSAPPMVYLSSLKIGEKRIDLTTQNTSHPGAEALNDLQLSHDQNSFSIAYTGIQYDNPRKNKFAYILENYDDTWREVDNLRTAFYYNLPAGKYTFRVKAANSNGVWSDDSAAIDLEISPPWWQTWWAYTVYSLLAIGAILGIGKFVQKRNMDRLRAAALDKELAQAKEIEKAYAELKSTQAQLIQSEKMASLGELTAGIAHEIQNPLNFVNNFSELNSELLTELKEEIAKGNFTEVATIAADLSENESKITHHGKRADAIVKGMLAHSRSGKGEKSPTDLNALTEEYLKLSYHGLRAKDKSFNAHFKTDFDPNLPKVNVVPQDIGRVLLNLINNAFQAVNEKSRKGEPGYKPEVSVETRLKTNNQILITIRDNGPGIPDDIKDKIFQPFFTTKPTGQGTGLGLSLSYDIVKAHGGEIILESTEGQGTEFIITLHI